MSVIPTLITPRLLLRPFSLADAGEIRRLAGDFLVADTTLNIPHPYEEGMAEAWISSHAADYVEHGELVLAVALREKGTVLGAVSLLGCQAGHQAELGYWIGVAYWGRGYCTEAAAALVRHAFAEMGLQRVHSCHLARNPASGRVMQKVGLLPEGIRRHHVMKSGQLEDICLYGLLKADWQAMRPD